ncbi:predicted protein [Scheffersomyces stipitis CBS 6054]|uniref:Uncharacterized protein n=1 Tax=Scheffersomyces stipitis (strain ATCC 58785 / CBS 6054 / NBRC 10063 / NRRL Y-11545) TaxID=322104 RepID=A3LX19_PICST|nr:predicted protein [Scheffersomyces stipitis CBS 6054]ABN67386.2 predicted protein [Scheffersomyces stipitis CBS 6054]
MLDFYYPNKSYPFVVENGILSDLINRFDRSAIIPSQQELYRIRQQQERERYARRQAALREREYERICRQQAYHQLSRPSHLKQLETSQDYQIQVFKRYGDFNNYQIRVVKNSDEVFLKIHSDEDDFDRSFHLDEESIDVHNVTWKWLKGNNALVVYLPKLDVAVTSPLTKEEKRKFKKQQVTEKIHKSKQRRLEKKLKKRAERELAHKQREEARISRKERKNRHKYGYQNPEKSVLATEDSDLEVEPIFGVPASPVLEPVVAPVSSSTDSEYETPSESEEEEETSSPSITPTHTISLEEIEDEEFVNYNKRLADSQDCL